MTETWADQLRALANDLATYPHRFEEQEFDAVLSGLSSTIEQFEHAWSGSPLGYHASVYYANFQTPPAGAHFSREWGFLPAITSDTHGDWQEYQQSDVIDSIFRVAGQPDLTPIDALVREARGSIDQAIEESDLVLSAFLAFKDEAYVRELKGKIAEQRPLDLTAVTKGLLTLTGGSVMSRDSRALSEGFRAAPHQVVIGRILSIRLVLASCENLARMLDRAARYIDSIAERPAAGIRLAGTSMFIGHGRSPLWRELKDFLKDRLDLPCDEFNMQPVAGVTNVDRLSQMLDNAAVAFLVLTAEDERTDGQLTARQNVIHEVGLFQGRLGFSRAIVMLEEGCEEFSNISGLGQIRFPRGNIAASFEDVRRVLERESVID